MALDHHGQWKLQSFFQCRNIHFHLQLKIKTSHYNKVILTMEKNVKKIDTFTMKCEIFGIVFSFEYSSRPYGFHQKGEKFSSRPTCVYCLFSQPHVIREFHHHARVGTIWRPSEASVGTIPDIGSVNVESATGGFVDLQSQIWDDICSRQSIRFITVEWVSEKQQNIYTIYTLCIFFV